MSLKVLVVSVTFLVVFFFSVHDFGAVFLSFSFHVHRLVQWV